MNKIIIYIICKYCIDENFQVILSKFKGLEMKKN